MGKYYGTMNISNNMDVSCYCKGRGHTPDMWNIMAHRYKWNVNDYIVTASYCDAFAWTFVNGEWKKVFSDHETGDNREWENEELKKQFEEWHARVKKEVENGATKENVQCGIEEIICDGTYKNQSTHYPEFDENGICVHCKYQFNAENIEKDKKKFHSIFFCA